jgi:hypothetical protein
MLRSRTGVAVSAFALLLLPGCKLPTSPGSGSGSGSSIPTFTVDSGLRFNGSGPAPVARNGMIYVYQNTGNTGTSVQGSSDGVTFAQTPASYPAGQSRSIVALSDGRVRMYYFSDGSSLDMLSAVSSDGLNWSVEAGVRFTVSLIVPVRVSSVPTGFRLYYRNSSFTINSAFSSDGLTFTDEGPVGGFVSDGTIGWGDPYVIYVNGRFQMVIVKFPGSSTTNVAIWHATSSDGRTWSVDNSAFASDPANNFRNPALVVNDGVIRLYWSAQALGSSSGAVIVSGVVRF